MILIGIIVVLGVWSAIPDGPAVVGSRPDGISMFDAMSTATEPVWVRWLHPVIGVMGTLLGAKLQGNR